MISTDPGPTAMNLEADPSAFAPYRHPEPITFDEDDGLG